MTLSRKYDVTKSNFRVPMVGSSMQSFFTRIVTLLPLPQGRDHGAPHPSHVRRSTSALLPKKGHPAFQHSRLCRGSAARDGVSTAPL